MAAKTEFTVEALDIGLAFSVNLRLLDGLAVAALVSSGYFPFLTRGRVSDEHEVTL